MNAEPQLLACESIAAALRAGPKVAHAAVPAAMNGILACRTCTIEQFRRSATCLDHANSLASLGYGAEYPLGLHLRWIEQTRDGHRALIEDHLGGAGPKRSG